MNVTSTLIANLHEAGLATVTGGVDWVVDFKCWALATMVDSAFPGLGALIALHCYIPL